MEFDGTCLLEIVNEVVKELIAIGCPSTNIVLRSTVPVGTSEKLGVNFMPEFLTEAHWEADVLDCKDWFVGCR